MTRAVSVDLIKGNLHFLRLTFKKVKSYFGLARLLKVTFKKVKPYLGYYKVTLTKLAQSENVQYSTFTNNIPLRSRVVIQ